MINTIENYKRAGSFGRFDGVNRIVLQTIFTPRMRGVFSISKYKNEEPTVGAIGIFWMTLSGVYFQNTTSGYAPDGHALFYDLVWASSTSTPPAGSIGVLGSNLVFSSEL